ncbi:MAG: rhodanese-like domain-containing protein, partial [Alphaproteobacteria bacterium]
MDQPVNTGTITAQALKSRIVDGGELALFDVREEGVFGQSHLLFAVCLPLSHLELRVRELAPRRNVPMVLCDGGEGLAQRAAVTLAALGYSDISLLDGGIQGWQAAGFELFGGVNVPSKAFGEFVEHQDGTPSISADELKSMQDDGADLVVLDSRPWGEYQRMSIPAGIDMPGAELAYRVHDVATDPDTLVVVNCAGRTRSIIGAQSLINAGIPNRVVALRNGTMGWALAGNQLDHGETRRVDTLSAAGLAKARAVAERVAERFGIATMDMAALAAWRAESDARSLFVLDVRNPEEFESGHLPGSISAPGGQLVQATDRYVGVMGARLALVDNDGVRATMTASWLIQLGWRDVAVLKDGLAGELETGPAAVDIPASADATDATDAKIEQIAPVELHKMCQAGDALVVDLATSLQYRAGHVPGAWWAVRARLEDALGKLPAAKAIVFTSPDGVLARLAASDSAALTGTRVLALAGGTQSWVAAGLALTEGLENLTGETDDVQYKAYDYTSNIEAHMQEYL